MAKRKTIQERETEELIKKSLNELGRKVTIMAGRRSKVSDLNKLHLRDSGNYRVKPFDTLIVSQVFYGKYNTPKGQATPKNRENLKNTALTNSVDEFVPEATKVIVKNMLSLLTSPIIKK